MGIVGEKKREIFALPIDADGRLEIENREWGQGVKTPNQRSGGRKKLKKYFSHRLQIEKLHLPLHPGSQGTENEKRENEKAGVESLDFQQAGQKSPGKFFEVL
jgi:hypothetical protein